jgi:cupin fold WbuC family metalloprotein
MGCRCVHNMTNVFHNADDYAVVGPEWIERLKKTALTSPLRRSRLCLHRSDDDKLHEMVIALARDCLFPPHRHTAKSESFHIIDGRLIIVIFKDDGTSLRSLLLTSAGKGGALCYRMCKPSFHAVLPLDEVVVFHEVTNGPFVKNEAVFADWAPTTPNELRSFLVRAALSENLPVDVRRQLRDCGPPA